MKRLRIQVSGAHVTGNEGDFAVLVAIPQLLQRPDKTSACVVAARSQRAPAEPGAGQEGPSAAQAALSKALEESGLGKLFDTLLFLLPTCFLLRLC